MSPGAPSETTSSGGRRPAGDHVVEERRPGVGRLRRARRQVQAAPACRSVVIPQATSTGSALAPWWYLKWLPSRNRYSSSTSARSRRLKASNSSLIAWQTRLTVDFETVASGPERLGEGRLDVAHRQPPHEAGDDERLEGVGACHALAEQARGELLGRAPQLRALEGHRAGGRLHRQVAVAVARPGPGVLGEPAPLVAVAAEELGDLGLEGALQQQAGAEAGHLLQGVAELAFLAGLAEEVVDLRAELVGGRYSCGHGCGSSFCRVGSSWKEPTPVVYLHRGPDATPVVTLVGPRSMIRRSKNQLGVEGGDVTWSEGLRDPGQTDVAGSPRGHQVVLAGPGTGKTYVLVRRVEHLIEVYGLSASRIACLTFTRAAAAEMRVRLDARLGDVSRRVRVSTLHSFALRELLREGVSDIPDPVRVVGDWEERWVVVEELARTLGRGVHDIHNERGTGALDRLADDWESLAADNSGWEAGHPDPAFLGTWRRHRRVYGYTLRAELVYQLLCELRSNPEFEPGRGIDVLLVDEYQDLNRCDLDTVALISERADAEVFAAGDDDQSIYSFRHAHPAGIRNFVHEFTSANRLTMTECLRCGPEIVEIANWLIQQEADREPKTLTSVTEWGGEVTLASVLGPGSGGRGASPDRRL